MSIDTGTPAPAGHHEAMVAKVDAAEAAALAAASASASTEATPAATPPARPENVPEKFWDAKTGAVNVDGLLKSYVELEKSRTTADSATPTATDAAKAPEAPAAEADKAAAQAAVGADKFTAYSKEFAETGSLSEASYKTLEQNGIPKAMVDAYIQGQVALASSYEAQGYSLVGGKEQYTTMLKWASTNLTASEVDAFDRSVTSGKQADMQQAVLALRARYESSYGSPQSGMVSGTTSTASTGYGSEAEMVRDMKDPRYNKDAAYRRQVESRIASTTAF